MSATGEGLGLVVATLVIGIASCGNDGDDRTTAPAAANATPRADADDLGRYLRRRDEEPGFRPGAAPGAMPSERVSLYATAEGARRSLAHDVRGDVIRAAGPVAKVRLFSVPGIPGARGWTASVRGEPASDRTRATPGTTSELTGNPRARSTDEPSRLHGVIGTTR
jgi:hypothetical protein